MPFFSTIASVRRRLSIINKILHMENCLPMQLKQYHKWTGFLPFKYNIVWLNWRPSSDGGERRIHAILSKHIVPVAPITNKPNFGINGLAKCPYGHMFRVSK